MRWWPDASLANWVGISRRCVFVLSLISFFVSAAEALKFLRLKNLIHRDIKPQVG